PRARFTIAHELGHMCLGHKKTRHRNISSRVIEKIAPTIKRDEYQADRFAGAFLAPAPRASHNMPTAEISRRFMMSNQAAKIRKEELERLHRQEHGIIRPLPEEFAKWFRGVGERHRRMLPSLT